MIKTALTGALGFLCGSELPRADDKKALGDLLDGNAGYDGAGWLKVPKDYPGKAADAIRSAAQRIIGDSEVLVVIASAAPISARAPR
jgi:hypothetical protein